jgi:hypothetical protein
MSASTYPLKLPTSVKTAAARLGRRSGRRIRWMRQDAGSSKAACPRRGTRFGGSSASEDHRQLNDREP